MEFENLIHSSDQFDTTYELPGKSDKVGVRISRFPWTGGNVGDLRHVTVESWEETKPLVREFRTLHFDEIKTPEGTKAVLVSAEKWGFDLSVPSKEKTDLLNIPNNGTKGNTKEIEEIQKDIQRVYNIIESGDPEGKYSNAKEEL